MARTKSSNADILAKLKPKYDQIKKSNNKFYDAFQAALHYCHYDLSPVELRRDAVKYVKTHNKEYLPMIEACSDYEIFVFAKYCHLINHGCDIPDNYRVGFEKLYSEVVSVGNSIIKAKTQIKENKEPKKVVNIQNAIKENTFPVIQEFDEVLDKIIKHEIQHLKDFIPIEIIQRHNLKSSHNRYIIEYTSPSLGMIEEVLNGTAEQDIRESYSHFKKAELTLLRDFYLKIIDATLAVKEAANVNRKARAPKPVSKEKVVAKMKYMVDFKPLNLVSQHPRDIIGAKEVWVYNTKTRKLGKYIALDEAIGLSVKGTSIVGYSDFSVEKILRTPEQQLKDFKMASKQKLKTFMDEVKTVDTKLNGRMSDTHIILRVHK